MNGNRCLAARREWSDAFDGGAPVSPATTTHLEQCPDCREFQAQAVLLREQLPTIPLPAASPDRDRELLALLQSEKFDPHPGIWVGWQQQLRVASVPVLGTLGFAAFAVTLVTAHLLTVLPSKRPSHIIPGGASARSVERLPGADSVDRWLSSPQPRLIPLRTPPRETPVPAPDAAPGAAAPAEPSQRGGELNSPGRLG